MMKIAFLIRDLGYGGAQRQLVTLAEALDRRRFEVRVYTFYGGGPLEKNLREANVAVVSLGKTGRWDVVPFCWRLLKEVRAQRPDILHGYMEVPNLLCALLKPLARPARVVWGVWTGYIDLGHYDWLSRLTFRLARLASRAADLIVFNSNAGRDYYLTLGFPGDTMTVIHNGFDTERFKPDRGARARTRAEWDVSEDAALVGIVGRLDPMKDHPTFLKAAALLLTERPDVRFACVGEGPEPYAGELRRAAERLGLSGRLIWAGARADMTAVYNAFDVVASSSYGEGFPNVIGEAMACGVPCVVTDVGDAALLVGATGAVVPPHDPAALAGALASCLAGVTQESGLAARRRIVEEFSLGGLIRQTEGAMLALK